MQINTTATQALQYMHNLDTPAWSRAVTGTTGLAVQPYIDYTNTDVPQETRNISAVKTAARVFIATVTGVATRIYGQKFGEQLVDGTNKHIPNSWKIDSKDLEKVYKKEYRNSTKDYLANVYRGIKGAKAPIPEGTKEELIKEIAKAHRAKSIGMVVSVLAAMASVFVIDVPFVSAVMDKFSEKLSQKSEKNLQKEKKSFRRLA